MKGKSYIKILKTTLREHLLITNTKIDKLQLGNKNHCDHWRVNSESFFRWLAHTFALTNSSFFSICAFCYCLLLLLVAWDGTWKSFRFPGSLGLLKRNRSTSLGFMRGIFKGFFWSWLPFVPFFVKMILHYFNNVEVQTFTRPIHDW